MKETFALTCSVYIGFKFLVLLLGLVMMKKLTGDFGKRTDGLIKPLAYLSGWVFAILLVISALVDLALLLFF